MSAHRIYMSGGPARPRRFAQSLDVARLIGLHTGTLACCWWTREAWARDLADAERTGESRRVVAELMAWQETSWAVAAGRAELAWFGDDTAAAVESPVTVRHR